MSQAHSISTSRVFGLARVCRLWRVPRSTVYHTRERGQRPDDWAPKKRGPVGAGTDEELLHEIRATLDESPWVGEGHRKVWAQLRFRGVRPGRERVLRIMREHDLLAPTRMGRARGPRQHDGSITPDRPNEIWGTDATSVLTAEGNATIFFVVDHCTAECLGIHAARRGTRFEALEPLRQALREQFGSFEENVASGVRLRHDHGSQFVSHAFQQEIRFLRIESSPAFVRQPEGNGCAERFVRTLKEQLLWLRSFETLDDLNQALREFMARYNARWLIERHGWRSPKARRGDYAA